MISNKLFNTKTVYVLVDEYYGAKYPASKSLFKDSLELEEIELKFYLRENGQRLGDLSICLLNGKKYETHSFSKKKYHNKGLGLFMYSTAADWCRANNINLYSSGWDVQSDKAHQLWESKRLRKKYKITSTKCQYYRRWKIQSNSKATPKLAHVKSDRTFYEGKRISSTF